jgi:hypothetical protein|nr:MAG TPA: Middle operon regulator, TRANSCRIPTION.2A [Caudoviricetes sp.]
MWENRVMQRDETARLLAAVKKSTVQITRAQEKRDAAIVAAFKAGVNREDIAHAAGLTRVAVYQIVNRQK